MITTFMIVRLYQFTRASANRNACGLVWYRQRYYTTKVEREIDKVKYKTVEGTRQDHDVTIFSLSTCAFCRRAIEFLKNNDVQFKYAHLDLIDVDTKRSVKRELSERFDNIVVFPILVVDDQKAYSGFTESVWARALDLE